MFLLPIFLLHLAWVLQAQDILSFIVAWPEGASSLASENDKAPQHLVILESNEEAS